MLITLEGIDGSGKSTLAKKMADTLHNVVLTKEPGGSALGKKLREILQMQPVPITPIAEFLLFAADRAQHFDEVVIPALEQNKIVISDRMADSSLVYQGYGRGINMENIKLVNKWVMQDITPDITFYLKIPFDMAKARLENRHALTTFEKEQESFTKKLIHGFDDLFKDRNNVIIIDGTQPPNHVASQALEVVNQWIKTHQ